MFRLNRLSVIKPDVRALLSALMIAGGSLSVLAVPAKPGILMVRQSDGSETPVRLIGDEYAHLYLTPEGEALEMSDGILYHSAVQPDGTLIRSERQYKPGSVSDRAVSAGLSAKALEQRRLNSPLFKAAQRIRPQSLIAKAPGSGSLPGLFPGSDYPVTGRPRALVILVEYADVKMSVGNPEDYFTRLLNERGFSDYEATGSALDYFSENSGGLFEPRFDVYGPVVLSYPQKYYGANTFSGQDVRPEQMIIEACQLLDDEVDFSVYDTNGDGKIDNVFVFYAGRGENDGGGSDTVWPHSSDISYFGKYVFDGVQLDRYACTNEWQGPRPDGVGTFIHEFSHVMGLPDLYSTDYSECFTPESWSVLDAGSYNNNSRTPPLYSAFERGSLGWLEPVEISSAVSATLLPLSANKAGIIRTESENEFFLVENRQTEGWDTYIPGHGMLVWHIDYDDAAWAGNTVNNNPSHQRVDIVEADGIESEKASRAADAFPGTAGVTAFTDNTVPAMRSWAGVFPGVPITDIKETDGLIAFNACGGGQSVAAPAGLACAETGAYGFTVSWEALPSAEYLLSVSAADGTGYVPGFCRRPVGAVSQATVDGLEPATEYRVTVQACVGLEVSDAATAVAVKTAAEPVGGVTPVALAATEVTATGFTANWAAVGGADDYILNVYTKEATGEPVGLTADFSDGIPEGWTTTATATYSMDAYAVAVPSLRMAAGDCIETADYPEGLRGLSFWHRGVGSAGGTIRVEVKTAEGWSEIARTDICSAPGGRIDGYASLPEGCTAARIVFGSEAGSLAVDDVRISYGSAVADTPVPGYEACRTGNALSCRVSGIAPGRTYYYRVVAVAGGLHSQPSQEVAVGLMSGIDSVGAGGAAVRIDGRSITTDCPSAVLYDFTGRAVSRADAGGSLEAPSAGFYILQADGRAVRILVK